MFACLDVDYRDEGVVAACVSFDVWQSKEPSLVNLHKSCNPPSEYKPGEFYRRELPYLTAVIKSLPVQPSIVIVDGYVWLGPNRPGLGKHLYDTFKEDFAVVGVAKKPFHDVSAASPVQRGLSKNPLWITSIGIDLAEAAFGVQQMNGEHRVPTLLKLVDRLCRDASLEKE